MTVTINGTTGLATDSTSAVVEAVSLNHPSSSTAAITMDASNNVTLASNLTMTGGIEIPNQNAINEITFTGTEFTNVLSSSTSGFQLGTTGAGYLSFLTSNTERIRIDSDGLKFNGDTAAANALSDFETGSWSPTLPQGGTVNTLYASYVKVGPLVVAYAFMTAINIPSDGNQFQIGGLPFTAASGNTYYYAGGSLSYSGSFNTNVFMDPLVQSSNTYLYFHRNDGNSTHIVNSNITGGNRDLIFQVIYHETL